MLRRPISETTNSLSVSDRIRSILEIFSGDGLWFSRHPWFESESQLKQCPFLSDALHTNAKDRIRDGGHAQEHSANDQHHRLVEPRHSQYRALAAPQADRVETRLGPGKPGCAVRFCFLRANGFLSGSRVGYSDLDRFQTYLAAIQRLSPSNKGCWKPVWQVDPPNVWHIGTDCCSFCMHKPKGPVWRA